jgi:hypothetical protein
MTFKLNPISEVYYRLRLAEGFLKGAEDVLDVGILEVL